MELKHDKEIKEIKNLIEREYFAFNQMRNLDEFTEEYINDSITTFEATRFLELQEQIKILQEIQAPITVGLVI